VLDYLDRALVVLILGVYPEDCAGISSVGVSFRTGSLIADPHIRCPLHLNNECDILPCVGWYEMSNILPLVNMIAAALRHGHTPDITNSSPSP
jgi:hypothetical protein